MSADLLFVFAGAPWRKAAGLAAWRAGAARTLVLSVGRFEWRRLASLDLPGDGGLRALVDATPAPHRHFLLVLERGERGDGTRNPGERVEARRVPKGALGTWSEALALASVAIERSAREVVVCTSGYHLPRALLSTRRALRARGAGVTLVLPLPVAEPPGTTLEAGRRLRSPRAWWALAREGVKWAAYAACVRAWTSRTLGA